MGRWVCKKKQCAPLPTIENAETCDSSNLFYMDTCKVKCAEGYKIADGVKEDTLVCDDTTGDVPAFKNVPTCVKVDCGQLEDASAVSKTCDESTFKAKCETTCDSGYSLDGAFEKIDVPVKYTCEEHSDDPTAGAWKAAGKCQGSKCGPLGSDFTKAVSECDLDSKVCEVTCADGKKTPNGETHMKCDLGEFQLCSDATCSTPPSQAICIDAQSSVEEVEVIKSAFTVEGLSAKAIDELKNNQEKAMSSFGAALEKHLALPEGASVVVTGINFPSRRLRADRDVSLAGRQLSSGVTVDYYVEGANAAVEEKLTKLASKEDDALKNFASSVTTKLTEDFEAITDEDIKDVGVSAKAPEKETIAVERTVAPTPAPTEAESSGALIVIIVIIVLAVIGGGFFFMKNKG